MSEVVERCSFVIVAAVLIILEVLLISKGEWLGDFWEHAAVVNELSQHPFHPGNPIIAADIPHAFFSPYSLVAGLFSRAVHLTSIQTLTCFAIINLVFLLVAFYLFCKSIFGEERNTVSTLALFFVLFLWGKNPFRWGGFTHIMALHSVLPYPSTFAIALALLVLSLVATNRTQQFNSKSVIIILLCSVVFIVHPPTAIFLFMAIIAFNFSFNDYSLKQCILRSAIIIIPSLIVSLMWPYFNVVDLMLGSSADFHRDSKELYAGVFERNWPFILLLPGLFVVRKDKVVNFFLTAIVLMIPICVVGYTAKVYGGSRLIPPMMMCAHFLIAYTAVLAVKEGGLLGRIYQLTLIVALATSLYLNTKPLANTYRVLKGENIGYYDKYSFVKNFVAANDIVLSDEWSNWFIPSFEGKVLSSMHPLYWVDDLEERRKAVRSFFARESSDSLRRSVLHKYRPDFILVDFTKVNLDSSTLRWLASIGQTVYEQNQIELIRVNQAGLKSTGIGSPVGNNFSGTNSQER